MNPQKQGEGDNYPDGEKNRRFGLGTSVPTSDLEEPGRVLKRQQDKIRKARPKKRMKAGAAPELRPSDQLGPETDIQRSSNLGTILLVEDNPEDVFIIGRAFQQVGVTNPLVVVRDGEQAIQYLDGAGEYRDRGQFPLPQLVLLDLNMPRLSGFEVLAWVRQQPNLRHLPVIVLTTSTYSPDVKRAYQLGANSFLTKPTDFINLISEVKAMSDFWLNGQAAGASIHPVETA